LKHWLKKNDILARTVCLLAAVLLWFVVMMTDNPEIETEFRNIKLSFQGVEALRQTYNLVIIEGENATVNVKIRGQRSKIAEVTKDKISATVNLSSVTTQGNHEMAYDLRINVDGVTVASRNPYYVNIKTDKIVSASVPVQVNISGEAPEGYYYDGYTVSPATVEIEGPQSEIKNIARAYINFDTSGETTGVGGVFEYTLVDEQGNEIVSDYIIKKTQNVEVSVPVHKVNEIPLTVNFASARGVDKTLASAEISPKFIQISSNTNDSAEINQINLGTIDLEKLIQEDNYEVDMPIILPNGIKNESGEAAAKVKVSLTGIKRQEFVTANINITGESAAQYTLSTNMITVVLIGEESVIEHISDDMIKVLVDLNGIELWPGANRVPAVVTVEGDHDVGVIGKYEIILDVEEP